jgi:amidase
VSVAGVVPLAPSFDAAGLLARDAAVLRRGADALLPDAGTDGEEGPPTCRPVWFAEAMDDVDPAVAAACHAAVSAAGLSPTSVALGIDLAAALAAFRDRQGWEAWQAHGDWIRSTRPVMGPGIAGRFEAASRLSRDDVARADEVRAAARAALVAATADGTVLVQPAAAGAAPPALVGDRGAHERRRMQTLRLTCVAGLAGAPVVVLPLARDTADGDLPLGVAFVGAPGSDRRLLRWTLGLLDAGMAVR